MASRINAKVWDETTNEKPATMTIPVDPAISQANADALVDAAMGLSIGGLGKANLVIDTALTGGAGTRPTAPEAQKEHRYKVSYTDDVTLKEYFFTIPVADLSKKTAGSENVPLTQTQAAILVTALETNGRSELGNAITVTSIDYVTY